jgi:hypothetical protein
LIDLTFTKIGTFLVIIDKGGEKSHKDKGKSHKDNKGGEVSLKGIARGEKAKVMTLERDQLKLSTRVGGASS